MLAHAHHMPVASNEGHGTSAGEKRCLHLISSHVKQTRVEDQGMTQKSKGHWFIEISLETYLSALPTQWINKFLFLLCRYNSIRDNISKYSPQWKRSHSPCTEHLTWVLSIFCYSSPTKTTNSVGLVCFYSPVFLDIVWLRLSKAGVAPTRTLSKQYFSDCRMYLEANSTKLIQDIIEKIKKICCLATDSKLSKSRDLLAAGSLTWIFLIPNA